MILKRNVDHSKASAETVFIVKPMSSRSGLLSLERGGLMTKQRAAILEVIRAEKCHHTAEEIFELAKLRLPGISKATVYNSLHYLEHERLIRRITSEDTADRYDSSFIPHGHLYCVSCNRISDFEIPNFNETLKMLCGEKIDSYELKVRYLCDECAAGAIH
jgi:Fe2+ or Zn2+ uptake regulation protein